MTAENIRKHAIPAGLEDAHAGPEDYARLYDESIRDPQRGANLALLACTVFMSAAPQMWATWRLQLGPNGAHAVREMPLLHIAFGRDAFSADPRLCDMRWER